LHSSAPGSRLVRRSFAIGGQEKEGFLAQGPMPLGRMHFPVLNRKESRIGFQRL
jgi:hypothetical protein